MSTFYFVPPIRYDLNQIILGESPTNTGVLTPVASSTAIGTFPDWVNTYDYDTATSSYYYAIKWKYDNGAFSDWSDPRMLGKTGIESNYIIVNSASASSVYIMNPVSGDVATTVTDWLDNNQEYYITIDASLSGSLTLPLGEDYQFSFTSAYCPLFSNVNEVRFESGPFINNLTDDTINRIIHKNSKYILNKYLSIGGAISGTYTCDGHLLNDAFHRYITCKSSLDAITSIELSLGGNTSKKLADMQITYGGINSNNDPNNRKKALKECIDGSLGVIFGNYNFQVGVRGVNHGAIRHPMNDPTYGRLSTINKTYKYDNISKFDQVNLNVANENFTDID